MTDSTTHQRKRRHFVAIVIATEGPPATLTGAPPSPPTSRARNKQ